MSADVQPATYQAVFTVEADLPERMRVNLTRALGAVRMRRDWRGRLYFNLPPPFDHLRLYHRERLSPAKQEALAVALEYFDVNPVVPGDPA